MPLNEQFEHVISTSHKDISWLAKLGQPSNILELGSKRN